MDWIGVLGYAVQGCSSGSIIVDVVLLVGIFTVLLVILY